MQLNIPNQSVLQPINQQMFHYPMCYIYRNVFMKLDSLEQGKTTL